MGGSGGGGAGQVSYPAHMTAVHTDWLGTGVGGDALTVNVSEAIEAAHSANPFTAAAALDPSSELTAMDTAVTTFTTAVDLLDNETDWTSALAAAQAQIDAVLIDDSYIDSDIDAFADSLEDDITDSILPFFKGGLRNVNAVMSSAFVIGESMIWDKKVKEVAKYSSGLRRELNSQRNALAVNAANTMVQHLNSIIESDKAVMHYDMEANRLRVLAEKEQNDTDVSLDEQDALWDLEMFNYGVNVMGSIAGAAASVKGRQPSTAQSALGGALSGAAAGAALGPPGALLGAGIGALLSL